MENGNTNWSQSVTAVVIHEGKVLLSRHTYGAGKGRLIIPGGYLNHGEMPREALIREYLEETGVLIEPRELIGMRFNLKDWYAAFRADYVSGEARSDNDENRSVNPIIARNPASSSQSQPGASHITNEPSRHAR